MDTLIEMDAICKSFGPVQALQKVHLTLGRGEVLGLVGDNAAGKSTLMKVLSGVHRPDSGTIRFDGRQVRWQDPHEARVAGIEMVYQDLALAGNMDIVANIFMGREPTRSWLGIPVQFLDERRMEREARALLDRLRIQVKSVRLKVEHLSGGQRQAVAIARATSFNARLVVMDEPTAALAVKEVEKVLDVIGRLKEQGVSVIIISHRLQDILQVCDRVMVLCQGRNAGERLVHQTSLDEIVSMIVGGGDVNEVAACEQAPLVTRRRGLAKRESLGF